MAHAFKAYMNRYIVIPHCVAKSRNSAGVNFCTRSLKNTTITWHLHAPVRCCGQTGKVPLYKVKYRVSRYRFDGATKDLSNIDTIHADIFVSLSGSVIILISSIESNMSTKYIKGIWKTSNSFLKKLDPSSAFIFIIKRQWFCVHTIMLPLEVILKAMIIALSDKQTQTD